MFGFESQLLFAFVAVLQVLGLVSVAVVRSTEYAAASDSFQRIYFVLLLAVGTATILTALAGNSYWITMGITLAVMAVGATLDLCRERQPAEF